MAVLAFCATAAEAGVARDIGVIWRELRYGAGGALDGERYNFGTAGIDRWAGGGGERGLR